MTRKNTIWIRLLLVFGIVLGLNIVAQFIKLEFDLTEDKRFTLTQPTLKVVEGLDEKVYIKVLLDGEFPAGFKRLQTATLNMLSDFRKLNSNVVFTLENPTEGTAQEIMDRRDELAKDGIVPTSLQYYDGTQTVTKAIYPYAVLNLGNRKVVVPLLEEQTPGMDENVILNNSVSLLEYKFADAIQKVQSTEPRNIVFTAGQGEFPLAKTISLERHLRKFHNTGRIVLDSVVQLRPEIDLLIVAAPMRPMSLKNQFKIDQYLMNGGKVIWLIEKFDADLDSIAKYQFYVPRDIPNGLDDLLFKYGVRIEPNFVLDLECTRIPQVAGMQGDKPQIQLFQWPYHPLVASKSSHPIVKNIDRVNFFFPSSIDTVKTELPVKKTVLLESSMYSRLQFNPVRLNFEILKSPFDPAKFDDGNKPIAVLLEGRFASAFKNRLTADFKSTLSQLNLDFVEESLPTKQLVVSDADFAKNLINSRTEKPEEIGFNKWEVNYFKGNKDFMVNAVEYMLDEQGVLEARSKEVKLRLLDQVRTKSERSKWQAINLVLPVLLLVVFGLAYHLIRKSRYGKRKSA